MKGPLAGYRVIEVGHMLMGPYCGMLLGDLGAEVIKIEPATGDIARSIGPNYVGKDNVYFASLNRNKSSIVLDLASKDGQTSLGQLARESHALVTNLRPTAIDKLGLTYARLKVWNPRIVCVALTGYGLTSPHANLPAYDYVIQALTGVMMLTGDPAGPPTKAGFSVVDNSTAIMGALGLVAKLVQGTGGQIDIAMYDVMLSQLNYVASAWLNASEPAQRFSNSAHPYIVPAQNFRTLNGWLTLFITHDKFWRLFCNEVGRPQWVTDERFATMAARTRHREEILRDIDAVLSTRTTQDWIERLAPLGVVVAPVESLEAALQSEQVRMREMVVDLTPGAAPLRVTGNPIKIEGVTQTYAPPPSLGEHGSVHLTGSG